MRNGFDLISVNATRGEEQRVEEFPPNVTSFSIRRLDRYTRYRFSVAARTQVGLGEWHTEESPHYTTESNSFVASAAASRTCTDYDDLCDVCVCVSICPGPGGHYHTGMVHWDHVCCGSDRAHPSHRLLHQEEQRGEIPR